MTYGQGTIGLTAALAAGGGEVLPEEGVVQVTTAVEVDQGRLGRGLGVVALGLGLGDGLQRRVDAVDVGLVVLGVVELHDLGRDVGLKGSVVVCVSRWLAAEASGRGVMRSTYKGDRGGWPCRGQRWC